MSRRIHVIGAGMAGLAAATALAGRGERVVLYEAARFAGGRCRSYHDATLDCRIDNGNHLLATGNHAAMAYLARIGASDTLTGPSRAIFPFIDLVSGAAWNLRLNNSRLPVWIFRRAARVPDSRARDYLALRRLDRAGPDDLVQALMGDLDPLYERLIEPLAIAALNTKPAEGSAALLGAVLRETIGRGGAAARPRYPKLGLSESLVDPALAFLRGRGAELRFGARIQALGVENNTITRLTGSATDEPVRAGDQVILATPPWIAAELLPGLIVPDQHEAILNVHFRAGIPPGPSGFYGLLGGAAEWVFEKNDVVSITISAANDKVDRDADALALEVWSDLRRAFGLPRTMPAYRVVKEKRATFAATPAQLNRRPATTPVINGAMIHNLGLAGDYTATGLPATIEGAIRSGEAAARRVV
ncbi:hydroxysqualene dehydroxylase [Acidiphilium sp. MT5]